MQKYDESRLHSKNSAESKNSQDLGEENDKNFAFGKNKVEGLKNAEKIENSLLSEREICDVESSNVSIQNLDTLELVRLAQSGSEEAKERLLMQNSPLIKSVVRWFRDKGVENDDLYQLGCMGFLKAINNFDCNFNVKFSTYVVPMVIGEIKRFMRDDGAIKVSRAIKSLHLKINKFVDQFQKNNSREPSVSEISKHFKISEQEVVMAMDSAKMPVSLYTPLDDSSEDGLSMIDRYDAQENENFVDNLALRNMIDGLDERDKTIILMRYFDDKTQSEIAQRLGVSQVQVSRLENKILENLRKKLDEK